MRDAHRSEEGVRLVIVWLFGFVDRLTFHHWGRRIAGDLRGCNVVLCNVDFVQEYHLRTIAGAPYI